MKAPCCVTIGSAAANWPGAVNLWGSRAGGKLCRGPARDVCCCRICVTDGPTPGNDSAKVGARGCSCGCGC